GGATAARATPGGLVWQQESEPGGVADPRPAAPPAPVDGSTSGATAGATSATTSVTGVPSGGAPDLTVTRGEAPLTVARAVNGPVGTPLGHDRLVASTTTDNTGSVGLAENAPVARSESRTQVKPQVKSLAAVEALPAGPVEPVTAPENAAA